jgi:beta-lactam-binding protein with PASTA domain
MYKNVLQNIENIAIWPVISFVIFFVFFFLLLWWVFTADQKMIERMKGLPMDDAAVNTEESNRKTVRS